MDGLGRMERDGSEREGIGRRGRVEWDGRMEMEGERKTEEGGREGRGQCLQPLVVIILYNLIISIQTTSR